MLRVQTTSYGTPKITRAIDAYEIFLNERSVVHSTKDLADYAIRATDGDMAHVQDFFLPSPTVGHLLSRSGEFEVARCFDSLDLNLFSDLFAASTFASAV